MGKNGTGPAVASSHERNPLPQDRLPPHDVDAEKAVLACCILSPQIVLPQCIERFSSADVFYVLANREIYECLLYMWDHNEPIELTTLFGALRDFLKLDEVGGAAYICSLEQYTPSAANAAHYIAIVQKKYALRKSIALCTEFSGRAFEQPGEVNGLFDGLSSDVQNLSNLVHNKSSLHSASTLAMDAMLGLQALHELKGKSEGIPTGFIDFDVMTGGLKPGEMIVIGARPGLGKSSAAMNIADYVAVHEQLPVCFFSLEMSADRLMRRAICSRAKVSMSDLRTDAASEQDFVKLGKAFTELKTSKLYIDYSPGITAMQLRAKAKRYHQQYGIKLFVIDYLQLIAGSGKRYANRQEEVADISRGTLAIGKELGVPVIVLVQLNREIEKEKSRKPRMSDIRECGQVEQDADIIAFLSKSTPEENSNGTETVVPINLTIAKSRDGATGDVALTFFKRITRFESASKVEYEPPPNVSQVEFQTHPD